MKITIPVSVGELLDKISILKIKSQHTDSFYVKKELEDLTKIAIDFKVYDEEEVNNLLEINQKLWDVEDELRKYEDIHVFNDEFITLARLVYTYNDQRCLNKKNINEKYNSEYREIKYYN